MGDIRLIGVIVGIIALFIFLVVFLTADVAYKIEIRDGDIPQGSDIELSYEIRNNIFWENIYNVKFNYWIAGETESEVYKTYPRLKSRDSVSERFTIETHDLPKGEHVIWTSIEYTRGGYVYSQHLSLKLVLY